MRNFLTGTAVAAVMALAGTAWAGCGDLTAQTRTTAPPIVTAGTGGPSGPVTPVPTQQPEG